MSEYGVLSRTELLAADWTDVAIRSAVSGGRLIRLRPGWYAAPGADPEVTRAVALGGALTCVSALRRCRVWVPEGASMHLRRGDHRRLGARRVPGITNCTIPGGGATAAPVDTAELALLAATRCVRGPQLVAIFDSVLNRRLLEPGDLTHLLRDAPRPVARALRATDGSAESGTETMVRLHVRSRRLAYRPQVFIPGVGTVDLLVGGRLVIESDSARFHTGPQMEIDRDRDLELLRLGFVPMRVTYQQVFHRFHRFAAALDALIAQGVHRGTTEIAV